MPEPLAICLEDLAAGPSDERYLRCTALVGRGPGLRVDARGDVQWKRDEATAAEIWVSLDDRLILLRPAGAVPVTVRRGGRSLDVPVDKPVVILDQDQVEVGRRQLRIHIHGVASQVTGPSPLRTQVREAAAGVAAAVVMSAALVGCCGPLEVREEPPSVEYIEGTDDDDSAGTATEQPTETATPATPPIEVREQPPAVAIDPGPPPAPPEPPEENR